MKPNDDAAEQPLESRVWVKALFWLAVASAWGLVVGLLAFIAFLAFFAGRPSPAARDVSKGMTGAQVLERAGRPDHEFEDATQWLFIIRESDA